MGFIKLTSSGNYDITTKFLKKCSNGINYDIVKSYAERGVAALSSATPKDTGKTSQSWSYEIINNKKSFVLRWTNSNIVDGVPIAIILQYGHGTKSGGYVKGRNYINPAIQPIMDEIAEKVWREVNK